MSKQTKIRYTGERARVAITGELVLELEHGAIFELPEAIADDAIATNANLERATTRGHKATTEEGSTDA